MRSLGRAAMSVLPVSLQFVLQRALLTPVFRLGAFLVLPVVLVISGAAIWLSEEANQQRTRVLLERVESQFRQNQRFNVVGLEVASESPELRRHLERHAGSFANTSPFDIDPRSLKSKFEELPAVTSAQVNVVPGGNVEISVVERKPEVVLRQSGSVALLDRFGDQAFSGNLDSTLQRLPLISGAGAESNVIEALEIYAAAEPIRDSIRGLVRIGERRWDLMLDGNRIIQLPEDNPGDALKQLLAFDRKSRLLSRDVRSVDLRVPDQVAVSLAPDIFAVATGRRTSDDLGDGA
ncbi:MAG: cell division protein FtsQ/DivIB [Rhodobacteraceae bacterium]|nr:cell division protein FtsQ/DivIB [Paracoccaceae bacterium]